MASDGVGAVTGGTGIPGFRTRKTAVELLTDGKRFRRTFCAPWAPEPRGENGPLTPALSPSEGERGNRRQRVCNGRFMERSGAIFPYRVIGLTIFCAYYSRRGKT